MIRKLQGTWTPLSLRALFTEGGDTLSTEWPSKGGQLTGTCFKFWGHWKLCTDKFRQTPRHTQTITHRHGHLLSDTLLQNYFGLAAPHNTPQNELIVDSWAHKQQNKQVTCISPPLATVSYHHSLYNKILANVTIPFFWLGTYSSNELHVHNGHILIVRPTSTRDTEVRIVQVTVHTHFTSRT